MRWPIRLQILVPFVGVVILSVTAIAIGAAYLAARRGEQQTVERLRTVVAALDPVSIPLTEPMLTKMRELSGAHFISRTESGSVVAATLPTDELTPESLNATVVNDHLDSFGTQSMLTIGGTRYFAATLQHRGDSRFRSLIVLYPEQDWTRLRRDAAVFPLAVGAATVLITMLVAGWVAQQFSSRIRSIERQVAAIAGGDFTEIPLRDRDDEVQDLVSSVNRMCRQLRRMQDVIRESDRAQLLAQLAGGLAHQLRNAITGARLSLQIHQRRCAVFGDETLAVALRQLALTETHVKGMLALGRGERRMLTRCDVSRIVQDVVSLTAPVCVHAQVAFEATDVELELMVSADGESLTAALLNVLLNGIEAAGRGGRVSVEARRDGEQVVVDVFDSGSGPPLNVRETLFDPFVTSKPAGVGLGLAIARQVAVDLNGTLSWCRMDGLTRFRMSLPALVESSAERPVPTPLYSEATHNP